MNAFILYIHQLGLSEVIYYLFHILGFAAILIFNIIYSKKYNISQMKALILTVCTYAIAYIWVYFLAWLENRFSNWGANNIVRAFVWFPLIALIPNLFLKIDKRRMTDFIAPCCALVQAVSHIGCIFTGCCHGYPCTWGIYNVPMGITAFPIQLLEALVAAVIVCFCVWLAKKEDYCGSGHIFPAFLISFGTTRFFLEFLRDNEKIFGNVSVLALHAALMVVVGVVWLLVLRRREK